MEILFENDDLIAVNKTEYVHVEAGPEGGDSLERRVREMLASRQAEGGERQRRQPFGMSENGRRYKKGLVLRANIAGLGKTRVLHVGHLFLSQRQCRV